MDSAFRQCVHLVWISWYHGGTLNRITMNDKTSYIAIHKWLPIRKEQGKETGVPMRNNEVKKIDTPKFYYDNQTKNPTKRMDFDESILISNLCLFSCVRKNSRGEHI